MSKPSRQQCKKKLDGECVVCGEKDFVLLDAHRIIFGESYNPRNVATICTKCHRLTHAGYIRFDKKYLSTGGWLLHYWVGEEEFWKSVAN